MTANDIRRLACPLCKGGILFDGREADGHIADGTLGCAACKRSWPVRGGIPDLVDDAEVRGLDRFMRLVYEWIAPLHDPGTSYLLPLLQGSSEGATRDGHMRRLRLAELRPASDGSPPRLLEVGVGSGGNMPWLERDLPEGVDVEFWGVDFSRQMLELCRRRLTRHESPSMRLLLADGHALPFADNTFDRVFNLGGMGTYTDPRRALAEMARVARPGTPIVVVDEQLDPHNSHPLYYRLMFRALTFYDSAPRCPVAFLPPDATGVIEEQVSRFYYCLTFQVPARAEPPR